MEKLAGLYHPVMWMRYVQPSSGLQPTLNFGEEWAEKLESKQRCITVGNTLLIN
jgi:hypothetical protein